MKPSIVAPPVGQSFLDEEGIHWVVRSIRRAPNLEGFFLATLAHGKTPECSEGSLVLAPREYEALVRARCFRLIAPGIAHPVPFADTTPGDFEATSMPPPPGLPPSGSDATQ